MAKKVDGRRRFKKQLWAGFCDDSVDMRSMDTGFGGFGSGDGVRLIPAIFSSRKAAREQYEDIRRIEIRELGPTPRKSPQ